jgi:hypothetical protein
MAYGVKIEPSFQVIVDDQPKKKGIKSEMDTLCKV